MTITLTPKIDNAITERAEREGTTTERFALDGLRRLFVTPKLPIDEVLKLAPKCTRAYPIKTGTKWNALLLTKAALLEDEPINAHRFMSASVDGKGSPIKDCFVKTVTEQKATAFSRRINL